MATTTQKRVATSAQNQYDRYHLIRENQEPLSTQIREYWRSVGEPFPGVSVPWSAVFVSWCVRSAGVTKRQFAFSAQHSEFVFEAIKNSEKQTGVFLGRKVEDYSPTVGDIIQNNRSGNNFNYDYAASHRSYKSHSAIVVEVGSDNRGLYLRTIGGNESDSVGIKEIRLTSSGRIKDSSGLYIAIVQNAL